MTRVQWRFCITAIVEIFLAHALVYFLHEYCHAVVAWLFGWGPTPFAIDYGALTLSNILFQQDVGDGVDYAPIFASGHGLQAALIAAPVQGSATASSTRCCCGSCAAMCRRGRSCSGLR